ncbi:hypothetical protein BD289DRAFT_452768 [Coniella lustricola]|uniref:Helix-turn-helix domain-containing protein n=1 Tax=Coniella lustricola TaxID=2025994 RepID=A0A2T3A9U5_9PEZI|nr:hypothetical protein BD289DRAFT_452768 [Coniella lustricola]
MGSNTSKSVAQSTLRKFPNRAPGASVPPRQTPPASTRPPLGKIARERAAPEPESRARPSQASVADQLSRSEEDHPTAGLNDSSKQNDLSNPDSMYTEAAIQPDLAQRLREIGVVQPNPTYSPSSTALPFSSPLQESEHSGPIFPSSASNPVLSALEARRRLADQAEAEFESLGLSSATGRSFLQAGMIRDALVMRERGASDADIEHRLNLKKGVLARLGPKSLYKPTGGGVTQ